MIDQKVSPRQQGRQNSNGALENQREQIARTDPLLRVTEGAALLGISVPTFYRRVGDGTIPKPVKLGGAVRWPQSELLTVIERAKAQRHAA